MAAISIRNLDHLGLVAALCLELGIARMIDAVLPKTPPFKVSKIADTHISFLAVLGALILFFRDGYRTGVSNLYAILKFGNLFKNNG